MNTTTYQTARRVDLPGTLESMTVLNTMGKRIAWARLRSEITQAELAKRLDKSRATIVQYEQDNIMPPVDVISRLADLLKVAPEYLAFGRQGVDGLKDGKEIVPVSEFRMGESSEYAATGYALPSALIEDFAMGGNKLQICVLTHNSPHHCMKENDRAIVATNIKAPDRIHSLFLCRTPDGYDVVQFERQYKVDNKMVTIITGTGNSKELPMSSLDIVGAITASISRI